MKLRSMDILLRKKITEEYLNGRDESTFYMKDPKSVPEVG